MAEQHVLREGEMGRMTLTTGSLGEAIGGAGGVVLSILGLTGILPVQLAAVGAIALGGGLLFEGGAIAARYTKLVPHMGESWVNLAELGGGMTAEFMGGAAAMLLGILALLGVAPMILLPVTALVFGGTLVFGTGVTTRLRHLDVPESKYHQHLQEMIREAMAAAAGVQLLIGLGASALGIIALVGVANPTMLSLVAFLAVGSSILLSGSAITARMLSIFQH